MPKNRKKDGVGVGLIGLGTIGTGVARVLRQNGDLIAERMGAPLRLIRIADIDTETDRGVNLDGIVFDADAQGLVEDPQVDIVVELIGGYDVARRFTLEAIRAGKHVVTANKALLALHGREIFGAAAAAGVDVAFEASVGGGIPILRSLREGLCANRIHSVQGILNGTTNYVLTEMEKTGESFEIALKRAQDLGYAEADPTFDVDGIDAAHKLCLLAAMAFGVDLDFNDIPTEGIRHLVPLDFEIAAEFDYRIKMLGIAKEEPSHPGRIEARVHPTLIPRSSMLAAVDGALTAFLVDGDAVGSTLYYGAGAGEMPTASAVVADLMELGREVCRESAGRVAPLSYPQQNLSSPRVLPLGELQGRLYLRFEVVDLPGVLSHVTGGLADHGIGIESVIQRGPSATGEPVTVVVWTHPSPEAAVREALKRIDTGPEVLSPTRVLRIEEEVG
ncbi:MAG: homoserine dehydrogenase [Myxococcota bacterium]|nr:homoserine dehydrogenase [Myxococcota bacterium]